jgi:hypothetical protein
MYHIDKENQEKLINLFHLENPSMKDKAQQYKFLTELSRDMVCGMEAHEGRILHRSKPALI